MIVVAWPVHGAGTDPEAFMLAFYHHSPTFIDLFMVKVLISTWMVAFMKKNSDEYEDIDQGVLNSDMPTGGLFASCGWAIYPKGGAIGPLFTFFTLDNYMKTDKVIINMMVLIKSYNKKEYCILILNSYVQYWQRYCIFPLRWASCP